MKKITKPEKYGYCERYYDGFCIPLIDFKMIENIFETEPYYINEKGVKWWIDKDTTNYARRPDRHGITLEVTCFYVEELDGRRTRILINKDQEILKESQKLEAMAIEIDARKFLKRDLNDKN